MKTINTYISEKLRLTNKRTYTCQPKDKYELWEIITQRIEAEDFECDLNDIDVSKITDMSWLFDTRRTPLFNNFNGDISMWDVSNVKDMYGMFYKCEKFNCDLSMWNVSSVKRMTSMFLNCKNFDCDLSKWNVSNVENIAYMFEGCKKFNQNLNSWNVPNIIKDMRCAFYNCPTQPTWYDKDRWEKNI